MRIENTTYSLPRGPTEGGNVQSWVTGAPQYLPHQVYPTHPYVEFPKEEIEQSIAVRFEQQGREISRSARSENSGTKDELPRVERRG